MDTVNWELKTFEQLDTISIYRILDIRNKVFVEGQQAIYLDTDFKDLEATHLMGFCDQMLVAYCRLFKKDIYYEGYSSIGRVAVLSDFRGRGLGKDLLTRAIDIMRSRGDKRVKIAAQAYLEKFYSSFGFAKASELYMLEGLLHLDMILTFDSQEKFGS